MAALKPMGCCTRAARARTAPGKPASQESQKGVIRLMQRCSDAGLDAPAAWRGSRASEKRLMKDGV